MIAERYHSDRVVQSVCDIEAVARDIDSESIRLIELGRSTRSIDSARLAGRSRYRRNDSGRQGHLPDAIVQGIGEIEVRPIIRYAARLIEKRGHARSIVRP
jgi:hypothetical protein